MGNIELGARKKQTLEMDAIVKKGGLREEEKEEERENGRVGEFE